MPNETTPETSVRGLFDEAETLRKSLDSYFSSSEPEYQETLRAAIDRYQQCKKLINQASMFSMNESLEDLATSDMRYLATDYHLGELILKATSPDRKATLQLARSHLKSFVDLIDAYELLGKEERQAVESASSSDVKISHLPSDPAARRTAKIAQFKKEKELKAKVEALSNLSDDEDVRNYYKAWISLAIMQVVQSLDMIKMELDMLAQAPPPPPPGSENPGQNDTRMRGIKNLEYSEKLDMDLGQIKGGSLLSKDGKPLRPFVLLGKREQLKAGVFRPSHNLPTMTIDEYLEEERARGGIIEGGGEKSGIRPELDEDDEAAVDAATYKARAWDEFTEANPKGAGNTLNRG